MTTCGSGTGVIPGGIPANKYVLVASCMVYPVVPHAFKFHYKDFHRSTQKITELVSGKKVIWHVSDVQLNFVKEKTEWNGTDVVFEITKKSDKTELRFTHIGLVPAFECYGDCSGVWGFYNQRQVTELDHDG